MNNVYKNIANGDVSKSDHTMSKKLKDSPVSKYKPKWIKNVSNKVIVKEKVEHKQAKKEEKITWENF